MKTLCLNVSVSSAKTDILFDGAITAKVKLIIRSCKEIPFRAMLKQAQQKASVWEEKIK